MGTLNTAILLNQYGGEGGLGSDRSASTSSTPTIRIYGDGPLARYAIWIDNVRLGEYAAADPYGNVPVFIGTPLADGPHIFTFDELVPHAHGPDNWTPSAKTPVNYGFSVDTVSPPTPVITNVTAGAADANGRFTFTITGICDPAARSVRVYNGASGLGGAMPDAGKWIAVTTPQKAGVYRITATVADQAGNNSLRSPEWPITVGTVVPPQPTVPGVGVAPSATTRVLTRQVSLSWPVPPDGGSPITGYRILRNGVLFGTSIAPTYDDMTAPVTLTSYTVSAVNAVGEGPQSPAVTV